MRTWLTRVFIILGLFGGLMMIGGAQDPLSRWDDQRLLGLSLRHLQTQTRELGIQNPTEEFRLRQVVRDEMGQIHVRLDQVHQGVPVWGQQLIVHLNQDGSFRSVNGAFQVGITASPEPALSPQDARNIAMHAFSPPFTGTPEVELVLFPLEMEGEDFVVNREVGLRNGEVVLAYRIDLIDAERPRRIMAFVNANTGELVHSYDNLQTIIGTGHNLYSGTVPINTETEGLGFILLDRSRGEQRTNNMKGEIRGNGEPFIDLDNVWGNGTTTDEATVAVDVHFAVGIAWDYYRTVHGRNGILKDGKTPLSRVHYGVNYADSRFDPPNLVSFGDGGDVEALTPHGPDEVDDFKAMVSLDIVGHEVAHLVTDATAGLLYGNTQSGALNEAMSDIFGTMVEHFAPFHGAHKLPNYLFGEDVCIRGGAIRDMGNPTAGSCYNMLKLNGCTSIDTVLDYKDGMDNHCTSGIVNNAFYLLAKGGTHRLGARVTGIDRKKAEKIFYRALTTRMIPSETFCMARLSTIGAAAELYGGTGVASAVNEAWSAVGVSNRRGSFCCPPDQQLCF